jgi:hypothetical protein
MCFIIIWADAESYERRRVEMLKRQRPLTVLWRRLVSMFSGRETPPPEYDEATSMNQSHAQAPPKRPDSLTLPKYETIRKHGGSQVSKEGRNPPTFTEQGKA